MSIIDSIVSEFWPFGWSENDSGCLHQLGSTQYKSDMQNNVGYESVMNFKGLMKRVGSEDTETFKCNTSNGKHIWGNWVQGVTKSQDGWYHNDAQQRTCTCCGFTQRTNVYDKANNY